MEILGAVLAGVLAFFGALLGHWVSRKSARELEVWRRREETLRMLRWASEMAVQGGRAGGIGLTVLMALGRSELLQTPDQDLLDSVMERVMLHVKAEDGE